MKDKIGQEVTLFLKSTIIQNQIVSTTSITGILKDIIEIGNEPVFVIHCNTKVCYTVPLSSISYIVNQMSDFEYKELFGDIEEKQKTMPTPRIAKVQKSQQQLDSQSKYVSSEKEFQEVLRRIAQGEDQ